MSNLLQMQQAHKAYGSKILFEDASFSVNEGEHIGVIGPNGAGKSTLFKVLVKQLELDSGQVIYSRSMSMGYLEQEEHWSSEATPLSWLLEETKEQEWYLKKLLNQFGVTDEMIPMRIQSLSGGYRMRVKLTSLIAKKPSLLLLDEPTNYLDLETLVVLENFLQSWKGAFLLISHDREFLNRVTDHTLEVEAGDINKFPGNIEDYFEQKAQLQELLQKQASNIQNKKNQIIDFANRFRAKATKAKQVQSRLKALDKMESISIKSLPSTAKIPIPAPTKTAKETLRLEEAQLGYGEKVVLDEVNFRLERGDHLAIVGVNGAGKSTLLKSLAEQIPLLGGQAHIGYNVKLGYYAQHVSEVLDPEEDVIGELQKAAHHEVKPQEILDLAGALLFSGDDAKKKVRVLSGGERSRVALGQILLQKHPCLLLDEPTNHLDFQTVEALSESLQKYPGTLLIVSHDRSFVKGVANKILEIRNGKATFYPGTYDEYVWSVQKGVLSDLDAPTEQLATETAGAAKPTGQNYKKMKKELEKTIRNSSKELLQFEKNIDSLNTEIEKINQELMEAQGQKASEIAQRLHTLKQDLTDLETSWLRSEEQVEMAQKQLNELLENS